MKKENYRFLLRLNKKKNVININQYDNKWFRSDTVDIIVKRVIKIWNELKLTKLKEKVTPTKFCNLKLTSDLRDNILLTIDITYIQLVNLYFWILTKKKKNVIKKSEKYVGRIV